jgi:hypothetical protein
MIHRGLKTWSSKCQDFFFMTNRRLLVPENEKFRFLPECKAWMGTRIYPLYWVLIILIVGIPIKADPAITFSASPIGRHKKIVPSFSGKKIEEANHWLELLCPFFYFPCGLASDLCLY